MKSRRFHDWFFLAAGLILVIVPFLVANVAPDAMRSRPIAADFVASTSVAVILTRVAFSGCRRREEWPISLLGLWLIVSPWVLGFAHVQLAVWAAVAGGATIAAIGARGTVAESRAGPA